MEARLDKRNSQYLPVGTYMYVQERYSSVNFSYHARHAYDAMIARARTAQAKELIKPVDLGRALVLVFYILYIHICIYICTYSVPN